MNSDEIQEVLSSLEELIHPEISIAKAQKHPGFGEWYLKTVIPDATITKMDKDGVCRLWLSLKKQNPQLIEIVKIAFDWTGELIPYTWSVFLKNNMDVVFNENKITFVDRFRTDADFADKLSVINKEFINRGEKIAFDKLFGVYKQLTKPLRHFVINKTREQLHIVGDSNGRKNTT